MSAHRLLRSLSPSALVLLVCPAPLYGQATIAIPTPAARVDSGVALAACGQLVDAQTCRQCHVDQYQDWSVSAHAQQDIQCYECHGALHSGALGGCKRCHQAIHKKRFANWAEVTQFDDQQSADYLCMLCHKAHMGNLQANLKEGCAVCHGSAGHTALTDFFHAHVASAVSPMHVDQFVREHDGLAARLMVMPRGYAAGVLLGLALAGYGLCFVFFLPLGYSASALWESCLAGRRAPSPLPPPPAGECGDEVAG